MEHYAGAERRHPPEAAPVNLTRLSNGARIGLWVGIITNVLAIIAMVVVLVTFGQKVASMAKMNTRDLERIRLVDERLMGLVAEATRQQATTAAHLEALSDRHDRLEDTLEEHRTRTE
jgi:hypothetical protein